MRPLNLVGKSVLVLAVTFSGEVTFGQLDKIMKGLDKAAKIADQAKSAADHAKKPAQDNDKKDANAGQTSATEQSSGNENVRAFKEKFENYAKWVVDDEQAQVEASLKLQGEAVEDSLYGYRSLKWGKYDLQKLLVFPKLSGKVHILSMSKQNPPGEFTFVSGNPSHVNRVQPLWGTFMGGGNNVGNINDPQPLGGAMVYEQQGNAVIPKYYTTEGIVFLYYIDAGKVTVGLPYEHPGEGEVEKIRTTMGVISRPKPREDYLVMELPCEVIRQDLLVKAPYLPMGKDRFTIAITEEQQTKGEGAKIVFAQKQNASRLAHGELDEGSNMAMLQFKWLEKKEQFTIERSLMFVNSYFVAVKSTYKFEGEGAQLSRYSKPEEIELFRQKLEARQLMNQAIVDNLQKKYGEPVVRLVGDHDVLLHWEKDDVSVDASLSGVWIPNNALPIPRDSRSAERYRQSVERISRFAGLPVTLARDPKPDAVEKGIKSDVWKIIDKNQSLRFTGYSVCNKKMADRLINDITDRQESEQEKKQDEAAHEHEKKMDEVKKNMKSMEGDGL